MLNTVAGKGRASGGDLVCIFMMREVENLKSLWRIKSFGCFDICKSCLIDYFILFKTKVVIPI